MVVSWGNGYAVSKPDGLVWIGTTEELVGFSESPTIEGRDAIMESVLSVLPHLNDASLVYQTSCLRPVSPDRLPILGLVPNKKGMVIATAGGRKGIHLGPIMGRIAADLVLQGETEFDISALALDRFGAGG
jgi:glycine oxidase